VAHQAAFTTPSSSSADSPLLPCRLPEPRGAWRVRPARRVELHPDVQWPGAYVDAQWWLGLLGAPIAVCGLRYAWRALDQAVVRESRASFVRERTDLETGASNCARWPLTCMSGPTLHWSGAAVLPCCGRRTCVPLFRCRRYQPAVAPGGTALPTEGIQSEPLRTLSCADRLVSSGRASSSLRQRSVLRPHRSERGCGSRTCRGHQTGPGWETALASGAYAQALGRRSTFAR
jgi:hypothetical protein